MVGANVICNGISIMHRLRIRQVIQQGCPYSFVYKFVLHNHIPEISPTNQIAYVISSRYLEDWLDVDWSTLVCRGQCKYSILLVECELN